MFPPDPILASSRALPQAEKHARTTLARRIMLWMALLLAFVTLALTGASYVHVRRIITRQSLDAIASYAHARRERESSLFQLAEDHHAVLAQAIVEDLRARGDRDPVAEFERRFEKLPDGTTRSRREGFDGTRQTGVIISKSAAVNADLRRRVVSIESTIQSAGRLSRIRFLNTWMILPENISVQYWPSHPNDLFEAPSDIDYTNNEFYTIVDPQHNLTRKRLWTKQYIDVTSKECMVSLSTPVYDGDRFLGVLGHDVLLADLVRRTMEERLEGSYNLLLRKDGFLIAHPELAKAIEDAGGAFDIVKSGGAALQAIFRSATAVTADSAVIESDDGQSYLGVGTIPGPGWLLVTVYPKSLLEQTAYGAARVILLGGLIALLLELAFVYGIVQRYVGAPLVALLGAARRVESGDLGISLDTSNPDELGRLAGAFNAMAIAVRDREQTQAMAIDELKQADEQIHMLNTELHDNLGRLRVAVEALSTPVLEVWEDVLALPLIGAIDEERSARIIEKLLEEVSRTQCRYVILDVTGVEIVDTVTAHRLLKVVAAVELLGARCMLTGIRASVAQALVDLGADFGKLTTLQTLRHGLKACFGQMSRARPSR